MKMKITPFGSGTERIKCTYDPNPCNKGVLYAYLAIGLLFGHLLVQTVREKYEFVSMVAPYVDQKYISDYMDWGTINFYVFAVCISAFVVIMFYPARNLRLCGTDEGIYVLNNGKKLIDIILWEDVAYAYKLISYRGFEHIILSKKELTVKECRRMVNRGGRVKDIFMIPNCRTEQADVFFAFLEDHLNCTEIKGQF